MALTGSRGESSRGWPVPSLRRVDSATRSTAGLTELRRMVENHMLTGFSHRIWVVGEVGEPSSGDDGSLHFELLAVDEEGRRLRLPCDVPAGTVPELRDLLDRVHDADLDDVVTPGRVARVGGLLRYDFLAHRLALTVSALDPAATVEALTQTRERARERVAAGKLPTRQRGLLSTPAPVNVALVGGTDDPALLAAAQQLRSSGYGVQPRVLPVPLVGVGASARLCTAVTQAAEDSDVVLLVRGEGRPLSLAAFDGEDLARTIAELNVPVVTGLGGQGERTVCDEVAATVAPTADDAVALVVNRLHSATESLRRSRNEVRSAGDEALDRARTELERAAAAVQAEASAAEERAAEAAHRRWMILVIAATVAATALVAAALVTQQPIVLVGLLAVAAALAAARWWPTRHTRRGPMTLDDVTFARAIERLRSIRDELSRTSTPEAVFGLRSEADQLVARGEKILGRPLDGSASAAPVQPVPAPSAGSDEDVDEDVTTRLSSPRESPEDSRSVQVDPDDIALAEDLDDEPDPDATQRIDLTTVERARRSD